METEKIVIEIQDINLQNELLKKEITELRLKNAQLSIDESDIMKRNNVLVNTIIDLEKKHKQLFSEFADAQSKSDYHYKQHMQSQEFYNKCLLINKKLQTEIKDIKDNQVITDAQFNKLITELEADKTALNKTITDLKEQVSKNKASELLTENIYKDMKQQNLELCKEINELKDKCWVEESTELELLDEQSEVLRSTLRNAKVNIASNFNHQQYSYDSTTPSNFDRAISAWSKYFKEQQAKSKSKEYNYMWLGVIPQPNKYKSVFMCLSCHKTSKDDDFVCDCLGSQPLPKTKPESKPVKPTIKISNDIDGFMGWSPAPEKPSKCACCGNEIKLTQYKLHNYNFDVVCVICYNGICYVSDNPTYEVDRSINPKVYEYIQMNKYYKMRGFTPEQIKEHKAICSAWKSESKPVEPTSRQPLNELAKVAEPREPIPEQLSKCACCEIERPSVIKRSEHDNDLLCNPCIVAISDCKKLRFTDRYKNGGCDEVVIRYLDNQSKKHGLNSMVQFIEGEIQKMVDKHKQAKEQTKPNVDNLSTTENKEVK